MLVLDLDPRNVGGDGLLVIVELQAVDLGPAEYALLFGLRECLEPR